MTDEAAWLQWRLGGLGSSDIASASTGRYGGAYRVVAERIGIEVAARDRIDPATAERGHAWEHALAVGVPAHTMGRYYVVGTQTWAEHPDDNRWRATPDGLLAPAPEVTIDQVEGGFESKTETPDSRAPWDYRHDQCQWAMFVTGFNRWLLGVGVIDADIDRDTSERVEMMTSVRYRWVYRSEPEITRLRRLAESLWDDIEAERLPDPVDGDALAYVRAANADADADKAAGADGDIDSVHAAISERERLGEAISSATERRKVLTAQIIDTMGRGREATTSDGKWRVRLGTAVRKWTDQSAADFVELGHTHTEIDDISRYVEHVAVVDTAALKADHPDLYDAYRYETSYRTLTVKDMQPDE